MFYIFLWKLKEGYQDFNDSCNRFPPIINDVPPPVRVILNNPGGQKLFIIKGEYLLKGFGRAAFKFLLKSIKIELKSRENQLKSN